MIGTPRIDLPDIPYHIFSRGNNKQRIFFDERDCLTFLKILREARERIQFELFSYSLMENHFHLLLKMWAGHSLARLMHRLLLLYSRHINKKYGRVGHLFQSRYHANLVETDRYFLTVDRYIHLNAPRAGMVLKPEDHRWSSYTSRLKLMNSDWISHAPVLDYFGQGDHHRRIQAYREFTESALGTPEEWSHAELGKTAYIGSASFVLKMQARAAKTSPLRTIEPV